MSASRTSLARIIVSWFELQGEEEGGVGALCLPPFCVEPGKRGCSLESCFGFNWQEEAFEKL